MLSNTPEFSGDPHDTIRIASLGTCKVGYLRHPRFRGGLRLEKTSSGLLSGARVFPKPRRATTIPWDVKKILNLKL